MRIRVLRAALLLSMALAACSGNSSAFPRATRIASPVVPSYPNTQRAETRVEQGVRGETITVTTVQTTDPFATVAQFYRDQLTRQGWQYVGQQQGFVSLAERQACPLYLLYISDKTDASGATRVELRLVPEACIPR